PSATGAKNPEASSVTDLGHPWSPKATASLVNACGELMPKRAVSLAKVTVPNVVGMGRTAAENALAAVHLRYIAKFPFSAGGDGSATKETPTAGTIVFRFSVVT